MKLLLEVLPAVKALLEVLELEREQLALARVVLQEQRVLRGPARRPAEPPVERPAERRQAAFQLRR